MEREERRLREEGGERRTWSAPREREGVAGAEREKVEREGGASAPREREELSVEKAERRRAWNGTKKKKSKKAHGNSTTSSPLFRPMLLRNGKYDNVDRRSRRERALHERGKKRGTRAKMSSASPFFFIAAKLFLFLVLHRFIFSLFARALCTLPLCSRRRARGGSYQGRRGGHEGSEEERDEGGGPHFVARFCWGGSETRKPMREWEREKETTEVREKKGRQQKLRSWWGEAFTIESIIEGRAGCGWS